MKWSIAASSFLCFLLLFQVKVQPRAYAQQEQQTTKEEAKTTDSHRKESVKWQMIDEIPVLKIWELDGADVYPQVSILRVSDKEYRKFSKHPKEFIEFINKHQTFSKPVITAGPWVALSSVEQEPDPPCWVLTVVHGHLSTAIVSVLPCLQAKK
jgi:hypothetical protein